MYYDLTPPTLRSSEKLPPLSPGRGDEESSRLKEFIGVRTYRKYRPRIFSEVEEPVHVL
jgi:hypothetical protein